MNFLVDAHACFVSSNLVRTRGQDTPGSSHYVGHLLPTQKLGEYIVLQFESPLLENMFYENIYLSMVLNKKDKLVYKSHKLFITFHTFYQPLGVGGDLEHLYVSFSFQFHN